MQLPNHHSIKPGTPCLLVPIYPDPFHRHVVEKSSQICDFLYKKVTVKGPSRQDTFNGLPIFLQALIVNAGVPLYIVEEFPWAIPETMLVPRDPDDEDVDITEKEKEVQR